MRARGYALTYEEMTAGSCPAAAPVVVAGRPVAALGIVLPARRASCPAWWSPCAPPRPASPRPTRGRPRLPGTLSRRLDDGDHVIGARSLDGRAPDQRDGVGVLPGRGRRVGEGERPVGGGGQFLTLGGDGAVRRDGPAADGDRRARVDDALGGKGAAELQQLADGARRGPGHGERRFVPGHRDGRRRVVPVIPGVARPGQAIPERPDARWGVGERVGPVRRCGDLPEGPVGAVGEPAVQVQRLHAGGRPGAEREPSADGQRLERVRLGGRRQGQGRGVVRRGRQPPEVHAPGAGLLQHREGVDAVEADAARHQRLSLVAGRVDHLSRGRVVDHELRRVTRGGVPAAHDVGAVLAGRDGGGQFVPGRPLLVVGVGPVEGRGVPGVEAVGAGRHRQHRRPLVGEGQVLQGRQPVRVAEDLAERVARVAVDVVQPDGGGAGSRLRHGEEGAGDRDQRRPGRGRPDLDQDGGGPHIDRDDPSLTRPAAAVSDPQPVVGLRQRGRARIRGQIDAPGDGDRGGVDLDHLMRAAQRRVHLPGAVRRGQGGDSGQAADRGDGLAVEVRDHDPVVGGDEDLAVAGHQVPALARDPEVGDEIGGRGGGGWGGEQARRQEQGPGQGD
ncbi:hypothetical protein [Nonomuraea glycinis]|uniref:hypothetical protein n=1 Tax=Nonomuraea glycinis TaxID=2047744 RepID=UPI00389A515D